MSQPSGRVGVVRRTVGMFLGDAPELRPLTLRFDDPDLERAFAAEYFRTNLGLIRLAHVFGLVGWIALGVLAQQVLEGSDAAIDAVIRFGIASPMVLMSLAVTYRPRFPSHWERWVAALILTNGLLWLAHQSLVDDGRSDWGYAGLLLILAFCYILSRLRFVAASVVGAVLIAGYNVAIPLFTDDTSIDLVFADYFLGVFALMGMAAAYGLERSARLLFLQRREVERERRRADDLLHNTLPGSIVARLKGVDPTADGALIADGHPSVTVLFADIVGFTDRAGRIAPDDVVSLLDRIFARLDGLADRLGLEKIKTIGDAYMAVAGAPDERDDHAEAAAEMALQILDEGANERWPSGEPVGLRIGIASGPAVAGVIGRRKFAYDLWGDTVNLASRLEAGAEPGSILVAESTARLLGGRYVLSGRREVDLKGMGPTPGYLLLGRADGPSGEATPR